MPEKRIAKQNLNDTGFTIALLTLAGLVIPFMYYAHSVYTWAHENKPQGYKYPEYKQIWMTGVGAGSFLFMQEIITLCSTPLYKYLLPANEDEVAY